MKNQSPPRTIRGIDDDTWSKFKAACAIAQTPMGQKMTELILDFVERIQDDAKNTPQAE